MLIELLNSEYIIAIKPQRLEILRAIAIKCQFVGFGVDLVFVGESHIRQGVSLHQSGLSSHHKNFITGCNATNCIICLWQSFPAILWFGRWTSSCSSWSCTQYWTWMNRNRNTLVGLSKPGGVLCDRWNRVLCGHFLGIKNEIKVWAHFYKTLIFL